MFVYRLEVRDYDGDWCGPFAGQRADRFDRMTSRALRSYTDDFHHRPPPGMAYSRDEITGTFGFEGLIYWFPNLEDYVKAGGRVVRYNVDESTISYEDHEQVTFKLAGTPEDITHEAMSIL